MARRVAVACVLALAVAASASAQTGSSGTSTGQSSTTTQTRPRRPTRRRRLDRRRRRSSATLGCGLCRPPRCSRTVSGPVAATGAARTTSRATPTSPTSPAPSRVGIKDRAEIFGSFLFDTRIDRDVRPVFVDDPTFGGFIDRYPRVNQVLDRRQRRRLLRRREGQLWSECRPEARRRIARARHGQAADRRQGRRASAPARPTSRSTSSSARKRRRWSRCRATAATSAAAARRLRHAGRRVPLGRRRGVPVAQLAAGHRRAERVRASRRTRRRSRTTPLVGIDGSRSHCRLQHREPHARDARPHGADEERLLLRRAA